MVTSRQQALQSLWRGQCSVYVRVADPAPDPQTGRNTFTEQAVAEGVPCRLSFSRITDTQPESSAQKVTQQVKVFLDPGVELPPGSKLVITQNGVTGNYEQSGEPAIYAYHKEVPLALFERWA
jgi:hypothetical protein